MHRSNSSFSARIMQAVSTVWEDAGISDRSVRITPLYDLVANYPIWMAEVEGLSIERAGIFLAEKTGQKPDLGLENFGPISGFFYAYQYKGGFVGCILVEKRDPVVRRRFSVAHELGHYKLHFEPWLIQLSPEQMNEGVLMTDTMIYPSQSENPNVLTAGAGNALPIDMGEVVRQPVMVMNDDDEIEANQFAAALLMPESAVRQRAAEFFPPAGQPRGYLASRLAGEFLVSKEAMAFRLATLGL
jgi:Zn-dependent peptidase ImmA (M78 family)